VPEATAGSEPGCLCSRVDGWCVGHTASEGAAIVGLACTRGAETGAREPGTGALSDKALAGAW